MDLNDPYIVCMLYFLAVFGGGSLVGWILYCLVDWVLSFIPEKPKKKKPPYLRGPF